MPTKVRASLIEMWTRITALVKDDNAHVYWNGEDNMYPVEIEGVINNSPTAYRAAGIYAKFIGGSGVEAEDGTIVPYNDLPYVNKKKGYKITDIIRLSAIDVSRHNGVFIHVGARIDESGNLVHANPQVLDYCKCRISKEDDEENAGKIFYKDFAAKKTFSKKVKTKWFYPFSPDASVMAAQIRADAKIEGETDDLAMAISKYRGQVYYLNLMPQYKYALSPADSVYNDCDTEYRMGLYTNTQTRSGFLGKVVVVTQGLDGEIGELVKKDLAQWLGSENSGSLYHMDVTETDDITKVIYVNQLKPQLDDKLFVETDKRTRRNILGAFKIPEALVNASDGALFGTSSDTYREMKLFYCEQVEEEQEALEEALTRIGFPCKIQPIVKVETAATSDKQADAQAELKGSVGGVTALIALQTSVSQGYTSNASAIQILETIYGIDKETATIMIGTPIETAPATQETPPANV